MNSLRLIDPAANPRKRSLLYLGAFLALAFAVESTALTGTGAAAGRPSSFWLLSLLAIFCGAMALWLRWTPTVERARRRARPAGGAAARPRPQTQEEPSGLGDLASWRSTRARDFSSFDLNYLPPLPSTPPVAMTGKRSGKRRKARGSAGDLWAKVLDEFESKTHSQK